jgi:hypothetical protein
MKRFYSPALAMFATLVAASPANSQSEQDRRELMALYFASIAADRCDFHLNEVDADELVQAATALQKKLGLKDEQADVLFEEVEIAFEKQLPDACKQDGEAAKSYERVIAGIRKK